MAEFAAPGHRDTIADVTCVIPTHARDDLLAEAIASVVGQDVSPTELVVSDDVGSARTHALVDEWAGRASFPIRYVDASGPSAGTAGASRNAGATGVRTRLLAFLDDDDLWEPRFLDRLVAEIDAAGVDFGVGWTEAKVVDGSYRISKITPGLRAADVVARNPGFVGSNFVIRTAAFELLGGFDPNLTVSNDKDLLVRALLADLRYVVVPEVLVHNRIHGGAQLTDKTERRAQGIGRYMAKHEALLTPRDRRYLRAQIASVRRVAAPRLTTRVRSAGELVALRTVAALVGGSR